MNEQKYEIIIEKYLIISEQLKNCASKRFAKIKGEEAARNFITLCYGEILFKRRLCKNQPLQKALFEWILKPYLSSIPWNRGSLQCSRHVHVWNFPNPRSDNHVTIRITLLPNKYSQNCHVCSNSNSLEICLANKREPPPLKAPTIISSNHQFQNPHKTTIDSSAPQDIFVIESDQDKKVKAQTETTDSKMTYKSGKVSVESINETPVITSSDVQTLSNGHASRVAESIDLSEINRELLPINPEIEITVTSPAKPSNVQNIFVLETKESASKSPVFQGNGIMAPVDTNEKRTVSIDHFVSR